jgi:hypothetical protein
MITSIVKVHNIAAMISLYPKALNIHLNSNFAKMYSEKLNISAFATAFWFHRKLCL